MSLVEEEQFLLKRVNNEVGASILQFVIVFPLMMLIILGIIDIVRIQAVKSLLQAGVEAGAKAAITVPNLDIDVRYLSNSDYDYYRYQWAKKQVMDAASKVPLSTLVGLPGSGNWAEIVPVQHLDSPQLSNAALLRPYECARAYAGSPNGCQESNKNCFRHMALPDTTDCNSYLGVKSRVLREEPVVVMMRAKVKGILPIFDNMQVQAIATRFRPEIPRANVDLTEVGGPGTTLTTMTTTTTTTTTTTSSTSTTLVQVCAPRAEVGAAPCFSWDPGECSPTVGPPDPTGSGVECACSCGP